MPEVTTETDDTGTAFPSSSSDTTPTTGETPFDESAVQSTQPKAERVEDMEDEEPTNMDLFTQELKDLCNKFGVVHIGSYCDGTEYVVNSNAQPNDKRTYALAESFSSVFGLMMQTIGRAANAQAHEFAKRQYEGQNREEKRAKTKKK